MRRVGEGPETEVQIRIDMLKRRQSYFIGFGSLLFASIKVCDRLVTIDRDVYAFLSGGGWELVETINSMALFRKGREAELGLIGKGDSGKIEHPLNVTLLPQLKLSGYSLIPAEVLGAKVVEIDVYFRCLDRMPADFLPGARFTSHNDPAFSFKQEFFALYRIYPSSRWRPGETVKQKCNILILEGAPSGAYDLTLALLAQKGTGFEGRVIYRCANALSLP